MSEREVKLRRIGGCSCNEGGYCSVHNVVMNGPKWIPSKNDTQLDSERLKLEARVKELEEEVNRLLKCNDLALESKIEQMEIATKVGVELLELREEAKRMMLLVKSLEKMFGLSQDDKAILASCPITKQLIESEDV